MYVSHLKTKAGFLFFPIITSILAMVIFVKYLYISFPLGVGIFHDVNTVILSLLKD